MKKLLYVLLAIVLVIVVGIGALLALVDPNQFKPLLSEQVKKATGRDLVINGDISWRFFPSIGFSLGETEFKNPQGFAEADLVKLGSAELSVSVMPLFSQHLEIGNISLNDARVFIQTRKDGVSNLDGLGEQAAVEGTVTEGTSSEPATHSPVEGEATQPWTISLAGVEVVNASAEVRDDKVGTATIIDNLNFKLDTFSPGEWTQANFDIRGKNAELSFTAKGDSQLLIAADYKSGELKALNLTASAKDSVNDIESLTLGVDHFKVGDWANITFAAKGQIPDLAFNANGATRFKISTDYNIAELDKLTLSSDLKGSTLPRPEMNVGLSADATYDAAKGLATLSRFETSFDELALNGKGSFKSAAIPVIRFDVNSDNIDLDAFLGTASSAKNKDTTKEETGSSPSAGGEASTASKSEEPDLSALKTLDIAGTVAIKKLKASNARVSDVLVDLKVQKGVLNLKRFNAKLYGGTVSANATVDANGKLPKYQVTKHIKGVDVHALLKDVAQNETLAGTGNIDVKLSGIGLAEKRIRENVAGSIAINFADGAIYGVNIPEMIREAKATLKGKKAEYVKEEKKTDFSALKATFKIGKSVASSSNIHLASPLLRIDGKGNTNLVSERLDFIISTSVVASSKGQGGKDIDDIADLTVPVNVKGDWTKPTFALDLKELFKQNNELEEKAKKEIDRGLEKLLGDKSKDDNIKKAADKLLKGLFN